VNNKWQCREPERRQFWKDFVSYTNIIRFCGIIHIWLEVIVLIQMFVVAPVVGGYFL